MMEIIRLYLLIIEARRLQERKSEEKVLSESLQEDIRCLSFLLLKKGSSLLDPQELFRFFRENSGRDFGG